MKSEPVSNLTKETKNLQNNLTVTACRQFVTLLPFFEFPANFLNFLTKTENRIKKSLTQLSNYCFE